MVYITFRLQLLTLLLILRQSDADGDHFGESNDEMSSFEQNILKRIVELEHRNKIMVSQCYVICCYYDTAICSIMLL
jgi:hypothetical protein